jgi:hypothetical protein
VHAVGEPVLVDAADGFMNTIAELSTLALESQGGLRRALNGIVRDHESSEHRNSRERVREECGRRLRAFQDLANETG